MVKENDIVQFGRDLDKFTCDAFFVDYLIDENGDYIFEFGPFEVAIEAMHKDGPLEFVTTIYGLYQQAMDKSFSKVIEKLKKEQGNRALN